MLNQDEIMGKLKRIKGQIKQGVAGVTGSQRLRDEGEAVEVVGEVQEGAGRVRRTVGEAVNDLGDHIKKSRWTRVEQPLVSTPGLRLATSGEQSP
jgi:uncharacterized protein YjbJ (UPF0337 family)